MHEANDSNTFSIILRPIETGGKANAYANTFIKSITGLFTRVL